MQGGGPAPLALPLPRMRRAWRFFRRAAPGASRFEKGSCYSGRPPGYAAEGCCSVLADLPRRLRAPWGGHG
eukprot:7766669-Pyramimonas_sp.AAC.1